MARKASNELEVLNAAKTLFANIRFMRPDNPIKTIAITSSVPNEGKSTTALKLGEAIAQSGVKVLMVEADMRRRTLAYELNVRPQAGIYGVISGAAKMRDAVVSTQVKNLYFLDVEPNIPNPADIISSHRFKELIDGLSKSFDYIIFDTPPVGTFVDAAILSTMVDGTVLVMKNNSTKREDVIHGYEQLQKAGANVLGLCATFVQGTGSEYYYSYYTQDGKKLKKQDAAEALPAEFATPSSKPLVNDMPKNNSMPLPNRNSQALNGAAASNTVVPPIKADDASIYSAAHYKSGSQHGRFGKKK